jgi:hypothetical protein
MKKISNQEILDELYNLILNVETTNEERKILLAHKASLDKLVEKDRNTRYEYNQLLRELAGLAAGRKLSAGVSEFYSRISRQKTFL